MLSIHLIEFRKHSKVFFGVIVVGYCCLLFIFKQANVMVTDVHDPLVVVFRNSLVLACAVYVFTHVS